MVLDYCWETVVKNIRGFFEYNAISAPKEVKHDNRQFRPQFTRFLDESL